MGKGQDTSRSPLSATPLVLPAVGERELRIDMFRGLALWLIFIDHVSPDVLSWFTIRSYGFSDAAEIFIFISGYTASFVYGRTLFEHGFVIGAARILRRVWQIYATHILLFAVLIAEIAFVFHVTDNTFYLQEMEVVEFFKNPGPAMIQALLLRFRPLNMDVLPLYVLLMTCLPLILALAKWRTDAPLVLSVVLYLITLRFDVHLSAWPSGFWSFNPFAWQLLFVFGAWCALGGGLRLGPLIGTRSLFGIAIAYLLFCFCITLSWYFPQLETLLPAWLAHFIYPIDKTDLDILRFGHFLALAVIALRFVPPGWSGLDSPWVQPMILCGQYSLQIFALGVALSFAGYALLMELHAGLLVHVLIGLLGIAIMTAVTVLFTWYKRRLAATGRARKAHSGGPA